MLGCMVRRIFLRTHLLQNPKFKTYLICILIFFVLKAIVIAKRKGNSFLHLERAKKPDFVTINVIYFFIVSV